MDPLLICLLVGLGIVIGLSIERKPRTEGSGAELPALASADENDVRSLFSLLGTIAACDGHVSEAEKKEVEKFLAIYIPLEQRELALASFEIGIQQKANRGLISSHAFELYWDVEREWLEPIQILDILIRVAVVDKQIDSLKEYVIETVAETLGVHKRTYKILRDTLRIKAGFSAKDAPYAKAKDSIKRRGKAELKAFSSHEILGVSHEATAKEVQKAYRELVKKYHPDKLQDKKLSDSQREEMLRRFCEIQEAYESICSTAT